MSEKKRSFVFWLSIPAYLILAVFFVWLLSRYGGYPLGAEAFTHIYKGNVLYHAIGRDDFFPLYDPLWYNGAEMFRTWAPLPVYVQFVCQLLGGGDPMRGYLFFVGMVFVFGGVAFSYVGFRLNRPVIGAFFGLLWFFLPHNLYVLFVEGNLPRALCAVFLPLLFYQLQMYLQDGKRIRLIWQTLFFFFIAAFDSAYGVMLALCIFVYLLLYGITQRLVVRCCYAALPALLAYLLLGVWLLGALSAGLGSNAAVGSVGAFQSVFRSLNPLAWYIEGMRFPYFSLVAGLLALFGVLCAPKRYRPAFFMGILLLFSTSNTAYQLLGMVPFARYLGMLHFLSFALCFLLLGMLGWRSLKQPIQLVICLLLLLDCGGGLFFLLDGEQAVPPKERLASLADESLISSAQKITRQRLTLLDDGTLGDEGAYLVSAYQGGMAATFGADSLSAETLTNIAQLNRAAESGQYNYIFDRCLELGSDSVLIRLSCVPSSYDGYAQMDEAAFQNGYSLSEANAEWRLYHIALPEHFGMVSKYDAIGIGSSAGILSLGFPSVEESARNNLNDYSFEELSQYRSVYLSGFSYSDKDAAEELVKRLADAGVRVVILADGMPEDPSSRRKAFLGVDTNRVRFRNGYPEMEVHGEILNTDLFAEGYADWDTVYMTGLDESYGWVSEDGLKLDFFGSVYNENIIVLGLNISYHYALTHDRSVGLILQECFSMESGKLPERRVVELTLKQGADGVVVSAPEDGVNTTLAWHDSFRTDQPVSERNHLLYVDHGDTTIDIIYPYLLPGLVLSIGGLLLLATCVVSANIYERKREEKANALSESGA